MDRKQKKEEQQRFACLDVIKVDDLVKGAQAKTTKYFATKYAVIVFQGNFCIQNHILFLKKMYNEIKHELYAIETANAKSVQIKFYMADRLPCFGCQMFKI